jgi:precorrin-6B C5,15-methyltransferase / cobalt-precorrin-6B C5,C15-methyltransferase
MQEKEMSDNRERILLGLPDEAFVPRRPGTSTMTKREVRAVTLANLELCQDTVLWDIGSGTGSVAIEAARLANRGHVYAVECDPGALAALETNCQRLHAANVTIVAGRAPQVLHGLPDPDAIFVGGSGGALLPILQVAMQHLRTGGLLVVNLASFEHLAEAVDYIRKASWSLECTMVNIARTQRILDITRFAALNPVFILTARAQRVVEPTVEAKDSERKGKEEG